MIHSARPTVQQQSLFSLELCFVLDFEKWGRTDNTFENSDHYLWVGLADEFGLLKENNSKHFFLAQDTFRSFQCWFCIISSSEGVESFLGQKLLLSFSFLDPPGPGLKGDHQFCTYCLYFGIMVHPYCTRTCVRPQNKDTLRVKEIVLRKGPCGSLNSLDFSFFSLFTIPVMAAVSQIRRSLLL